MSKLAITTEKGALLREVTKQDVLDWVDSQFLEIKSGKKQYKLSDASINLDVLREDLRQWILKEGETNPKLRNCGIADFIVKFNNGQLTLNNTLKMYAYWIKKLPEGEELKIKVEQI